MNKIKNNKLKAFSIIELMISITLSIVVIITVTQFLINFTKISNVETKKADLLEELRVLSVRLEKEIEQGSSLLYTYKPPVEYDPSQNPITSDENRIIFTRQVYNKNTHMPASLNPSDTNKNDVIIIEYTGNDNSNSVKYGKLLYSKIPAPFTINNINYKPSQMIIKRSLNSSIINSSSDNSYTLETKIKPFTYYDSTNTVQIGSNVKNTSLVKIALFARKEEGKQKIRTTFDYKVYLRNFIR